MKASEESSSVTFKTYHISENGFQIVTSWLGYVEEHEVWEFGWSQVRDDLIRFTKVDLFEILLKYCFRDKF